jgi:hypothetical protein
MGGKEEDYIINYFHNSIHSLASDALEQVKSHLPGCITCDLLLDFEVYYKDFLNIKLSTLSERQIYLLSEIDRISDKMSGDDFQCLFVISEKEIEKSNYKKVLETVEWNKIRKLSKEYLISIGEVAKELPRYKMIGENVWQKKE